MFSILSQRHDSILPHFALKRGMVFGILIIAALLSFEMFNYSTTEFSLRDLLGNLSFMDVSWATILSIAFCTIDFAGLARLFTPEQGTDEPVEVWYLFCAWILAAIMNAMLTWWGVAVAIVNHPPTSNTLVSQEFVLKVVPVFVALMVFLIRVLIIGTFSVAGERLFSQASHRKGSYPSNHKAVINPASASRPLVNTNRVPNFSTSGAYQASARAAAAGQSTSTRPEPTYHPLSIKSVHDPDSS